MFGFFCLSLKVLRFALTGSYICWWVSLSFLRLAFQLPPCRSEAALTLGMTLGTRMNRGSSPVWLQELPVQRQPWSLWLPPGVLTSTRVDKAQLGSRKAWAQLRSCLFAGLLPILGCPALPCQPPQVFSAAQSVGLPGSARMPPP